MAGFKMLLGVVMVAAGLGGIIAGIRREGATSVMLGLLIGAGGVSLVLAAARSKPPAPPPPPAAPPPPPPAAP